MSNYKTDTPVQNFILAIMLTIFIAGYSIAHTPDQSIYATEPESVQKEVVVIEKVVYKEPETPAEYIEYVFGDHAPKAFLLLQGEGCSENKTLNPYAVNDNTTWGGVGRDRGIFQISDYWHPTVTDAMAFDWKQNIDYAYRMFKNDNYTFARWTCGRYHGI